MQNQDMNQILAEILAVPSLVIKTDRFVASDATSEADCSGICHGQSGCTGSV
jgi:hypothetical protein